MIFNLLSKAKDLFYNNVLSQLKSTNVQDAIDEVSCQLSGQIQTATGSTLTLTNTADGYVTNVSVKGKSEHNGTPTPSTPIDILNSGDCVELIQGRRYFNNGQYVNASNSVCSKYTIPVKAGDITMLTFDSDISYAQIVYTLDGVYVSGNQQVLSGVGIAVPSGVNEVTFNLFGVSDITPNTVGKVELTINGKYVLLIKSVNKNLLDIKANRTTTLNGITFTAEGNKKGVAVSSTLSSTQSFFVLSKNDNAIDTGYTDEILYLDSAYSVSGIPSGFTLNFKTVDGEYGQFKNNGAIGKHIGLIYITTSTTGTYNTVCYPQIEYGNTVTDYVPHAESISTILVNEPLRAVGDVKDIIEYVDNGYKARRKIASVVFDGSDDEGLALYGNRGFAYTPKLASTGKDTDNRAMCDSLVGTSYDELINGDINLKGVAVSSSGRIAFRVGSGTDTLADIKALLASNPITVQYEMVEEVIEDIADQTPFYSVPTYEGGTTISTTDRVQPVLTVDYPVSDTAGVASKGYAKANEVSQNVAELSLKTDTLAENIKTINNRCKVIEATVQLDGGSAAGLSLLMPEGWNVLNSVILTVNYMYSDSGGVSNYNMYESGGIHYPQVFISGESIVIQFAGYDPTVPKSVDVKIVLMRTDV